MKTKFHYDSGARLITSKLPKGGHITDHFTWGEISNPSSGEDIILEVWPETLIHARIREDFRNDWCGAKGVPGIVCSSNYRTKAFNAKVGGIEKSLHLWGCASDLQIGALSSEDMTWIKAECRTLAEKYNTQIELGWYDWGIHLGSHLEVFNPYTKEKVYIFDERSNK